MSPVRGFAILVLIGIAANLTSARGQLTPPPRSKIESNSRFGNPPSGPQKEEELLEDFRQWLFEGKPRPKNNDIDPKKFQELMKKLNENKDVDPKQVEKLLKEHPELQNKDFLKQMEKMLEDPEFMKNLEGKLQKNDGPPVTDQEAIDKKIKEVIKSSQEHGDPKMDPKNLEPPKMDPNSLKDPNAETGKGPAQDNEWANWLEKNFGDSPGTQEAIKDLMSALKNDSGKGLFDDIPELKNGGLKDIESWGKANSGEFSKFKPLDLNSGSGGSSSKIGGGVSGPKFGGGSGGGSGPSFSGGGGTGLGGGVSSLAIIAGIVGALILAVILFRKWKFSQAERMAQGGYAKGEIDFDAIRSREELVRVFEAVSLDQHGEEARNWNHRVIAEQFRDQPAKAQPADEAADLYERARYAPAEEELTTSEFADARRDLRVIAGVTA
jgi:hypothetical protein